MKQLALRIIRQAGRRGAFLTFLAVLDFGYGYSLLVSQPVQRQGLNLLVPLHVWGILWLTAGVVCVSGIFRIRDRLQYTCSAIFKTMWALIFARVWFIQHVPLTWLTTVIFLAFAATVMLISGWNENGPVEVVAPPPPSALPDWLNVHE